jgi:hypothetical protein
MPILCEHVTEFPTLEKLGVAGDPDTSSPRTIAQEWFAAFASSIQSNDTAGAASLFLEDSFWKDILALTSDFRTIQGSSNIKALLDTFLSTAKLSSLRIADDSLHAPSLNSPAPGVTLLQLCFDFETKIGKGTGVCRLAPSPQGARWKAYLMFTCLDSLKGSPEPVGSAINITHHNISI